MKDSIDDIIEENIPDGAKSRKTRIADAFAVFTYSISVGVSLDYFTGVGTPLDIVISRVVNLIIGVTTAPYYGMNREYLYEKTHTTKHSNIFRKYFVELAAFNIIPTITYGIAIGISSTISSLIRDGSVDANTVYHALDKAWNSYTSLLQVWKAW